MLTYVKRLTWYLAHSKHSLNIHNCDYDFSHSRTGLGSWNELILLAICGLSWEELRRRDNTGKRTRFSSLTVTWDGPS